MYFKYFIKLVKQKILVDKEMQYKKT